MSVESYTPHVGLSLTAKARAHIEAQIAKNPKALGFRVGVKKSGCSGYAYVVDLVTSPASDDECLEASENLKVYIDRESLPFLNGTEVDYVQSGVNWSFQFNNPNMEAACGCGESFSVKGS